MINRCLSLKLTDFILFIYLFIIEYLSALITFKYKYLSAYNKDID